MVIQAPPINRVQIPSNKYGVGRGSAVTQISEHHAVGDAIHVINKAQGTAIFSTTYTIGTDGQIYQLVDENNTPYCDNDYRSNGRAITIEHAGGGNFPYTEAMYQSSIKLHAWIFSRRGILNCIGHKDIPEIRADPSKATACPGGLDYGRIVREAKALLQGGDEEMITKDDVGLLRIGHSEIGGWDISRTHAGEFDGLFLSAWQGKPVKDFIWAQWVAGAPYRTAKANQTKAVNDLQSALNGSRAELKAAQDAATSAQAKVDAEVKKATEAGIKTTQLEAERSKDVETGNSFLRWLGNQLNKLTGGK